MCKSICAGLVFCLSISPIALCQSLSDEAATELSDFLSTAVDEGRIPGVVAAVATPSELIYLEAFGMQNVAELKAMQTDSLFRIASMTKPVTSLAIMQLVEKGQVRLDDPIGQHLPEYAALKKLAPQGMILIKNKITIRHLLSHTSGYGYSFSNNKLSSLNQETGKIHDDLLLVHEPGEKWTYGCGTRILGHLVENLSGQKLDGYFEEKIFVPLGMSDTAFSVSEAGLRRLVTVQRRSTDGLNESANKENEDGKVVGDSGLRSTASDYARFLQMLLSHGQVDGQRIISADSVDAMLRNQIGNLMVEEQPAPWRNVSLEFPIGSGFDKFGLGFQLAAREIENQRAPGSYSWAGIYNTHFWADPKNRIAVVLMMQVLPFYDEECIQVLQGFEQRLYRGLNP